MTTPIFQRVVRVDAECISHVYRSPATDNASASVASKIGRKKHEQGSPSAHGTLTSPTSRLDLSCTQTIVPRLAPSNPTDEIQKNEVAKEPDARF